MCRRGDTVPHSWSPCRQPVPVPHHGRVNVVGNAAGSADAENPVYVILVEQLIGIDADRGHAHAAALYGNRYAVIGAGVAVHAADGIVAYCVFQKMFCDEFRPQRSPGMSTVLAMSPLAAAL